MRVNLWFEFHWTVKSQSKFPNLWCCGLTVKIGNPKLVYYWWNYYTSVLKNVFKITHWNRYFHFFQQKQNSYIVDLRCQNNWTECRKIWHSTWTQTDNILMQFFACIQTFAIMESAQSRHSILAKIK